jgi:hypothetical protein
MIGGPEKTASNILEVPLADNQLYWITATQINLQPRSDNKILDCNSRD